MSGALVGAFALLLVACTALAAACALRMRTWPEVVLAAYVVGFAEIVAVTLALSAFDAVTRTAALVAVVVLLAAAVAAAIASRPLRLPPVRPPSARALTQAPALTVLAVTTAAALAYVVALLVGTPPSSYDSLTYHLARAAFWSQDDAVRTIENAYDERLNAHPANAEIVLTFLLEVARNERLTGVFQLAAALALAAGVYALARKVGLRRTEAAFGALLLLTVPIVILQASTTQNDLVAAASLLAASVFLLGDRRRELVLAGLATALAVGTKVPAAYGVPLLLAIAVVASPESRRLERIVAVVVGSGVGAYWYVVNLIRTGDALGGLTETNDASAVLQPAENLFAAYARVLDAFDLSGAIGADLYLYVAAAVVLAVAVVVRARGSTPTRLLTGLAAGVLVLVPFALLALSYPLWRVFAKLHDLSGEPDGLLPVAGWERQDTASESVSWFGPLGLLLVAGVGAAAVLLYRRGSLPRIALVFAAAPLVAFVVISLSLAYDPWQGRFLIYAVALSAALWGLTLRIRVLAAAAVAVAVTTVTLSLVHYEEKPSGLALVDRDPPWSVWRMERPDVQTILRLDVRPTLRFVESLPRDASVALALEGDEFGYPAFGAELTRTVLLVPEGSSAHDLAEADWLLASPTRAGSIDRACWRVAHATDKGWRVYARRPCAA